MTAAGKVVPLSLKDAPSLIEHALPVQRLSRESYKEQMAVHGKTLTALGSYWKGRKPLILNKACVLGCLLPATKDLSRDLEIFELLMAMDDQSFVKRLGLDGIAALPATPYDERVRAARRPEELPNVHDHVWPAVNAHLGTSAASFPELVEQLGLMRFGRRPRVGDTFAGSGQIPFEAARLGCDVFASDLNPVACMLTWGAFHVVGGDASERDALERAQEDLVAQVRAEIDDLAIETDGQGWRAKVFLYCVEVTCPETGWSVPLLPTRVVSKSLRTIAELVPVKKHKRYDIEIRSDVTAKELAAASVGTVSDECVVHEVDGKEHRTKIATLRGDFKRADGSTGNKLRMWDVRDYVPREDDIFRERLYAIQWMKEGSAARGGEYEFRSVSTSDLRREQTVIAHVGKNLTRWQRDGVVPDMKIESGQKTDEPIRTRGWTYWHHLFNPRQLLLAALVNGRTDARGKFALQQVLNSNARLSRWSPADGGGGAVKQVFDNQALNPLLNYGCRSSAYAGGLMSYDYRRAPLPTTQRSISSQPASSVTTEQDIFITDPPYGDAVKYEEILEFFIAWLRKKPPLEFADWTWDSRRALAIKGEGEDFRRNMIAAYKRMTECMPDNGLQVIMFTHQSGTIWADMANIVWAAGLRVTAAWYVATETDSALRDGAYVKGTILLVLRKRLAAERITRDDLAWELQDEVERQVGELTGLTQATRSRYRDENLFGDADLQMAGYAAALRVLTRYAVIDGKDMTVEAVAPRVKGEKTPIDELIDFAVAVANQALVPRGLARAHWEKLQPSERLYLKLLDAEAQGAASLDGTQNFAKAFKVADFGPLLASAKAKDVRLKTAADLAGKQQGGELAGTQLRAVLYAVWQMGKDKQDLVIKHFEDNGVNLYDAEARTRVIALVDFLAERDTRIEARHREAADARALGELLRSHKL